MTTMAFVFTPAEPIKYRKFSYKKFLDYVVKKSTLRSLPFINEWRIHWLSLLQKEDRVVKDFIKKHSHTNPLLMRAKQYPEQFKDRNEMFLFVYQSGHGEDFNFHFDVEKMHYFLKSNEPSKITLESNDFYIDPDTNYTEFSLKDNRLPYFTPMFTLDKPYITIDGNKRIMAKLDNGIKKFEGYEITPEIVSQCFFTGLETWFYTLLYEIQLFTILMAEGRTSGEIKKYSNVFR